MTTQLHVRTPETTLLHTDILCCLLSIPPIRIAQFLSLLFQPRHIDTRSQWQLMMLVWVVSELQVSPQLEVRRLHNAFIALNTVVQDRTIVDDLADKVSRLD